MSITTGYQYQFLQPTPPSEGISVTHFRVTPDNPEQIGDILTEQLRRAVYPLCHLEPHEETGYWNIRLFQGDEATARKMVENLSSPKAVSQWYERTLKIGYVHVKNWSPPLIQFYAFNEVHAEPVRRLADAVVHEFIQWDLQVYGWGESDNQITEGYRKGAEVFEDVKAICIFDTVDALESWIKSFLRARGFVATSVTVQQILAPDGHINIRYTLSDCLIEIRTETIRAREMIVKPSFLSWTQDTLERVKVINAVAEHIQALIAEWKTDFRWKPIKPKITADLINWKEWFEYYHACKEAKIKYSLENLADDISLVPGYVRAEHAKFQAERKT